MGQAIAAKFFASQAQGMAAGAPGDGPQNPETTWWCRLLARGAGVIAGLVGFLTALFTVMSLTALCWVAGILLFFTSIVILVFEAPICCTFVEKTKPIAVFAEKRTYFQRAIIYVALAIIPLAMCPGPTTIVGCGLIFAAGVIYGIMGLGKKADRGQMAAAATGDRGADTQAGLIDNEDTLRNEQSPYMSGQSYPK